MTTSMHLETMETERAGGGRAVHEEDGADELAGRVIHLLGVAAQFEPFVDGVLARLRASMGVPPAGTAGFDDPIVEEEIAVARARLLELRAEFEAIEARLYLQHVGAAHLPGVVAALADERVQRLLRAQAAMAADAARALGALAERMTAVVLYEEPRR
jgi:hypothetical protein